MTEAPSGYRIGKVSKLTGINPDTLRIWERRYSAVIPIRTQAGGRVYSTEDVCRLKLIKNLVDEGDTIAAIANLPIDQLEHRVKENRALPQHKLQPESGLSQASSEVARPAPARRYSDQALAKIAAISPVVKCECPHHLAELISSLSAFEKYSNECEIYSKDDAELHDYLNKTASHARYMIENALEKVIEIEDIEI